MLQIGAALIFHLSCGGPFALLFLREHIRPHQMLWNDLGLLRLQGGQPKVNLHSLLIAQPQVFCYSKRKWANTLPACNVGNIAITDKQCEDESKAKDG